jgi:hypothetical protein
MFTVLHVTAIVIANLFKSRRRLEAENFLLRHQLSIALRRAPIGTMRRECVDHLIVFGETHLRRILREYAVYYNRSRTHCALNHDAPVHRAVQSIGAIKSRPILGGLHHHYCRI